jgi:hypothetical protein
MKNGRFKREHKGKHQRTQPRAWVPATVPPNPTAGVFTRAGRTLVAEYEQQRENDDTILGVLAHFEGGNDEAFVDLHALESQHTPGSMGTCNIDLWKTVFRDDAWRTTTPIRKTTGFGATHPGGGGALQRPEASTPGGILHHLYDVYREWSFARSGWAVLVPNRFLSDASFHTGYTPSWT